jgi:hypothetical protein
VSGTTAPGTGPGPPGVEDWQALARFGESGRSAPELVRGLAAAGGRRRNGTDAGPTGRGRNVSPGRPGFSAFDDLRLPAFRARRHRPWSAGPPPGRATRPAQGTAWASPPPGSVSRNVVRAGHAAYSLARKTSAISKGFRPRCPTQTGALKSCVRRGLDQAPRSRHSSYQTAALHARESALATAAQEVAAVLNGGCHRRAGAEGAVRTRPGSVVLGRNVLAAAKFPTGRFTPLEGANPEPYARFAARQRRAGAVRATSPCGPGFCWSTF